MGYKMNDCLCVYVYTENKKIFARTITNNIDWKPYINSTDNTNATNDFNAVHKVIQQMTQ